MPSKLHLKVAMSMNGKSKVLGNQGKCHIAAEKRLALKTLWTNQLSIEKTIQEGFSLKSKAPFSFSCSFHTSPAWQGGEERAARRHLRSWQGQLAAELHTEVRLGSPRSTSLVTKTLKEPRLQLSLSLKLTIKAGAICSMSSTAFPASYFKKSCLKSESKENSHLPQMCFISCSISVTKSFKK